MPGEQDNWKPSHSPWLIAIAVMLATFMEVMDTSIASVAVPYIAGSLSTSTDDATWVLTSYLIANAVFLPSSTWLSQKFGRKKFLMFSLFVFTAASFACGIATNLGFILIARAIQGAGGGALQPLAQAILIESFPPEKQGQALGLYALGVVVAPVIGPTFGGFLTDAISWRWAFYINIPVGALALLLQAKFLEDPPYIKSAKPAAFDKWGFGLLAIWTTCMQYILDKGQEDDWFSSTFIRWAMVFLALGLIGFLFREFLAKSPLVNLKIMGDRNFAIGCFLIFLFGASVYSVTSVLPLFYQTLMGYDATHAGIAVSPRGLGSIVAAIVVGAVASKIDSRLLVAAGFLTFALTALWTSTLTLDISPTSLFWPITLSGCALPAIFIALSTVALGTLPKEQIGNASGLYNLLRNIGGSVGIAVANTLTQRHLQTHRSEIIHSVANGRLEVRKQLQITTQLMQHHSSPFTALRRTYELTSNAVNSQAQLWAYVDVFRYLAIACAVCVPIAFLLKKTSGKGAAAG